MARFTNNDLVNACNYVNNGLQRKAILYTIKPQQRNGYNAIDMYKDDNCLHTITTGTPRECAAALYETAFNLLSMLA